MIRALPAALPAALALALASTASAEILVRDPYILSTNPRTAAAFMVIENHGPADRLAGAETPAARRAELHTHVMEDGTAKMVAVESGIALPAHGTVALERGGLHVMLIGLVKPLRPGESVALTLVLESGATLALDIPVVAPREAPAPGHHQHHGTPATPTN